MTNKRCTLVLDNLRSCYNVGSIIRSADGFSCPDFVFIGTTPYPQVSSDQRLPHQIVRQTKQIAKTALGAETHISGHYYETAQAFLSQRCPQPLLCLEQTEQAEDLATYKWPLNCYLVVGNELSGVSPQLLAAADDHLVIPLLGRKESLNVAVATALALYQFRLSRLT